MAIHYFDTEVAKELGILPSILLQNIKYWCDKNKANGKHLHDGYFWTYNSTKAFSELFDYVSQKQISNSLNKLKDEGYILTGNYNQIAYDRTLWYALSKKGESILLNGKMELPERENGFPQKGKPIPDNKHRLKKTDNKHRYGEYQHVLLSDDEKERFISEFGNDCFLGCVKILDEYCEMNGKSYKNYNLAMRRWVVERYKQDGTKKKEVERKNLPDKQSSGKFF